MTGSVILDVVIGLVFIFLLYSLLATIIQEIIATQFGFRPKVLAKAIIRMLEDESASTSKSFPYADRVKGFLHMFGRGNVLKNKFVAASFYAHPLLKYLAEDNWFSKPAYLSSQNFSKVIVDLLGGFNPDSKANLETLNKAIKTGTIIKLPREITPPDTNNPANEALNDLENFKDKVIKINIETALFLQSVWKDAKGNVNVFTQMLEQWYNDTMERASGWFKRYTQAVLLILGFIIASFFNVDCIQIAKNLSRDPKLREQLVQNATTFVQQNANNPRLVKNNNAPKQSATYTDADSVLQDSLVRRSAVLRLEADSLMRNDIQTSNKLLGLGWDDKTILTTGQKVKRVLGWLLTALAISLGAPFWFDMLNKLMKLRGSGIKINTEGITDTTGKQPDDIKTVVNKIETAKQSASASSAEADAGNALTSADNNDIIPGDKTDDVTTK